MARWPGTLASVTCSFDRDRGPASLRARALEGPDWPTQQVRDPARSWGACNLQQSGSRRGSHREPVCASDPRRGDATDLATLLLCTFCALRHPPREGLWKTLFEMCGRPVRLRLASVPANALPRTSEDARTAAWL